MKNIRSIFKRDMHGLLTNFFALVVAGGLCILPALYAWFNIYANWDPYGSTGNINIAVSNLDEGWTTDEGEVINMGKSLEDELRQKDSIGWVFVDSSEEAVDGVSSGKYYAALVIEQDFTYSMYHGVLENISNPHITYYVNGKKNAIATKITDTAVSTVQSSINRQFIKAVAEQVFVQANDVSTDLEEENVVGNFIDNLKAVNKDLNTYDKMISDFVDGNKHLGEVTDNATDQMEQGQKDIAASVEKIEAGKKQLAIDQKSFNEYSAEIHSSLSSIEKSIKSISSQIEAAKLDQDAYKLAADIAAIQADATLLSSQLGELAENSTDETLKTAVAAAQALLEAMPDADPAAAQKTTAQTVDSLRNSLNGYAQTVASVNNMYTNQIVPQVNNMLDGMAETLEATGNMLVALGNTMSGVNEILGGLGDTLDAANITLGQLQTVLRNTNDKLGDVIAKLDNATVEEQLDILLNFLSGDPEQLGDFFAQPVQVEEHYIYEISNYGSGVAPFYTTLAIWVGMTILVSLVKVHARKDGLENPAPAELYFGRYLMFFLLSQIQTAIIVLGDIYIFKVQCLHPFLFWVAAAVTSLTFSLLIYSLTLAFGDIGKALAVVVMVIQIAGSGGTYPIEALPSFFKAVYIFFPFPYAIDAMRECIGGMYQSKYALCLLQLGLFVVAALVIGLVIRIPFIKVNHFIEERMEDTEML